MGFGRANPNNGENKRIQTFENFIIGSKGKCYGMLNEYINLRALPSQHFPGQLILLVMCRI